MRTKGDLRRVLYAILISSGFTLEPLGSYWKFVSQKYLVQIYLLANS